MSARDELARTRRMPVPHRADRRPAPLPAGTRMLQGSRADLEAHMRQSGARAVGRWNEGANGVHTVPVVYVSRRAQPWVVRHRIALVATGTPLVLLAGLYGLVLWVGWAWFVGGLVAAGVFLAFVIRIANGHGFRGPRGGATNVSVSVSVKR
jgi:hypothetical protein